MSRLEWMTAWRHLRALRAPSWLAGLALRAAYVALVGAGFLALSAARPPPEPLMFGPAFELPGPDYAGILGALTFGTGLFVLGFCALARVFNLLATIITFSVAQGSMALVLVLGLMSGLEEDLRGRLLDHKAHVRVARADGAGFLADDALLAALAARPEVAGASPVLEGEVLVRTAFGRQGASLIGIVPELHTQVTRLPQEVEQGSYAFLDAPERVPRPLPPPLPRPLEPDEPATGIDAADAAAPGADALDGPAEPSAAAADEPAEPTAAPTAGDEPAEPTAAPSTTTPAAIDEDDGGWEDPSVEIPRLREAGALPPAVVPAVPEDLSHEPDAEDDEDGWEDPSVEIPRLRAEGKVPPATAPALPPEVPPGTPVAPDAVVDDPVADAVDDAVLPPVLLGRELAADLGVNVGDPLQIITPVGRITPQGMVPGVLVARVAGVFFTGIYDYDRKHLYLPLAHAQAIQRAGDQVNAVEIRLRDVAAIDAGKAAVAAAIAGGELVAEDWRDQNRDLFAAMFLEKAAMFIALVFVILVAAFGVLATNLMGVLEKAPEIAILKTMGCRDREVARIFALEGLCVGILGCLGGIAAGVGLGLAFGAHGIPLDGGAFYLQRLPIRIVPAEVALVSAIGLLIVGLSSAWPARSAARLRPVDGLRLRDE